MLRSWVSLSRKRVGGGLVLHGQHAAHDLVALGAALLGLREVTFDEEAEFGLAHGQRLVQKLDTFGHD